MGYDNRVHIVAIHENENEKSHWAEHLMTIELRGMANGFKDLFDKEVEDFYFFLANAKSETILGYDPYKDKHYEDVYGDRLTYTKDIKKVIEWLKVAMEKSKSQYNGSPYRRETMLYRVLNNFKLYDWRGTPIAIVHEGH